MVKSSLIRQTATFTQITRKNGKVLLHDLPNGTPARDNEQLISLAIAQGNFLGLLPTQPKR